MSVDRPTGRCFALHELMTPQIDQFVESRFRRDLSPQFLMVEGVGPSSVTDPYHTQALCEAHLASVGTALVRGSGGGGGGAARLPQGLQLHPQLV